MKKILIAHDGSKPSEKALKKAFEIAKKFGSAVTIISVVPELYLSELMEMDRGQDSRDTHRRGKKDTGQDQSKKHWF